MPQHRFGSVHVVGTNGKSSVAQMTAALLEAHGASAGACVSPHFSRWAERVRIHGEEIAPDAFSASVARTSEAAEVVNRALPDGEEVTQFEVATAAAFVALAAAGVEAAVIEAGLGGRLDATNVIPSRVTVLTSVGLDHTEWLGDTEVEIAAEKLAVLRDQSILVVGRLGGEASALAERIAAKRGAKLVRAPEDPGAGIPIRSGRLIPAAQLLDRLGRRRGLPRPARSRAGPRGRLSARHPRPAGADRRPPADPDRRCPQPRRCRRTRRGAGGDRRRPADRRLHGDPRRQGCGGDDARAGGGCGSGLLHGARPEAAPGLGKTRIDAVAGRRAGGDHPARGSRSGGRARSLCGAGAARAEALRRGGLLLAAGSHYLLATARSLLETTSSSNGN